MKRIALALTMAFVAGPAFAADQTAGSPEDPMAGWKPRKVQNEAKDKKDIQALLRAFDAAGKKGDLDAAVALVDFPVLMVTDDSKGRAMAESWTKEKWTEVMKPFYKPMPDMKVEHRPTVFVMTDSLATVSDVATTTMGSRKVTSRSSLLLVRVDGSWRVKSMTEGGWGDMMGPGAKEGTAQQK
ncbi:MAG: hypothetical protein ACJ79R_15245 [Anaeromyxobacteraceae bacterium]